MKILNCVSLFLLWSSCYVYANIPKDNPFSLVRGYADVKGSEIEVKNLPRMETQGVIPGCGGDAAAFMAQHEVCKINKISNCSAVSQEQQISMFSMIGWINKNTSKLNNQERADYEPTSYTNITFSGAGVEAIKNSSRNFVFKPQSCYPADKINNKFGNASDFLASLAKIQDLYQKNKNQTEGCESCLLDAVNANLDLNLDQSSLRSALQKNSFEEFLFKLIFKDCDKTISVRPVPAFDFFPKVDQRTIPKSALLNKIGETLKEDRPILLERICVVRKNEKECADQGAHSVAVVGYKEVCRGSNCRKLFKIQNPWGEDWQRQYDGGWVDAMDVVNNIADDPLEPGTISWYQ